LDTLAPGSRQLRGLRGSYYGISHHKGELEPSRIAGLSQLPSLAFRVDLTEKMKRSFGHFGPLISPSKGSHQKPLWYIPQPEEARTIPHTGLRLSPFFNASSGLNQKNEPIVWTLWPLISPSKGLDRGPLWYIPVSGKVSSIPHSGSLPATFVSVSSGLNRKNETAIWALWPLISPSKGLHRKPL